MGQQPFWLSCMEVWVTVPPELTQSFGMICAHYRCRVFYLPCSTVCYNLHSRKATHAYQDCSASLATKQIWRYNNSPPCVMARWPLQQFEVFWKVRIRPHNNWRHAPTIALEISSLFVYSLTCNDLGALSCPFKMALKMGAFQNPYFKAWYTSMFKCSL